MKISKKSFLWTISILLFPVGALLDFLLRPPFFTFTKPGATPAHHRFQRWAAVCRSRNISSTSRASSPSC